MRFISFLHSAVVIVFIVGNSAAATQYLNSATIFGRCNNFAIHAGTALSFNGAQNNITSGNAGIAPGTTMTGTPLYGKGYKKEVATTSARNCAVDKATAYAKLKGLRCTNTLPNSDLSGVTLVPGVYCTGSGFLTLKTTNLYLDARGDTKAQFIFQSASTLITSLNTKIILLNGASVKNVYWQVGSSATLGANSYFMGQILASASITVGSTVTVVGRLYAQAAVTCAGADKITLPSIN